MTVVAGGRVSVKSDEDGGHPDPADGVQGSAGGHGRVLERRGDGHAGGEWGVCAGANVSGEEETLRPEVKDGGEFTFPARTKLAQLTGITHLPLPDTVHATLPA